MTELDEALQAARAEKSQANFFYDSFLNADLLFPVQAEGSQRPAWRELTTEDRFHPLFIPQETLKVLPVFDRLERMQSWASPRDLDFIKLRAHILIRLLSKDVAVLLNPGTDFSHTISPEILTRLREAMKPVNPA